MDLRVFWLLTRAIDILELDGSYFPLEYSVSLELAMPPFPSSLLNCPHMPVLHKLL